MKEICNKRYHKKFMFGLMSIDIYSEDRYSDATSEYWNTLYKHFVTIYLLKYKVFHTFWRTGTTCSGNTEIGGFYEKEKTI